MNDTLSLRSFGRAYLRMAPAAAVVWLAAGAWPGPGVREAFIAAVLSVFVLAAAARAEGAHPDRLALRLALERFPSHSVNILLFLLFLALAAGVGGTIGGILGDAADLPVDLTGTVVALLAVFPILAWYWPAAALAVVVPEELGFRPERYPWLWLGPGYTSARRLARDFGEPARTAAILVLGYLWVGLLLAVDAYRGESPLPVAVEIASYGLFLPLVSWLVVVESRRLVGAALRRHPPPPERPEPPVP